jgi:hypothetical protein
MPIPGIGPDVVAAATAAVALEVAVALPAELEALTALRSVLPRSALVGAYDADVTPEITTHAPPAESQRRQEYANESGVVPVHDPALVVRVDPTLA